jgi:hypothetical protein
MQKLERLLTWKLTKEPTPAEVAAARAQEEQEQAALPYKWTQQISELDITFTVPGNYKSRDLVVEIKRNKLKAGVKGQDPIIDVRYFPLYPRVFQSRNDHTSKLALFQR